MAGKLIILCFLLAVVTIATCKPRNPFAGLSQRDILMLGEEKRGGGCPRMSYCSTSSNCQGSVTDQNGEEVGLFLVTPGTCGSGFNTVCCTEFMYYGGL
ncbi:unnamed protein product [Pocillopora meandrina]|uniref:Uncharacterized protein n=1 Tax=Pocillopora meandrina TaxID=46732 RepID=A0AAU9XYX4_9CNID|nr:unnamed protein product [Pocillopora meandrina]